MCAAREVEVIQSVRMILWNSLEWMDKRMDNFRWPLFSHRRLPAPHRPWRLWYRRLGARPAR
jgi:hypothetical protein